MANTRKIHFGRREPTGRMVIVQNFVDFSPCGQHIFDLNCVVDNFSKWHMEHRRGKIRDGGCLFTWEREHKHIIQYINTHICASSVWQRRWLVCWTIYWAHRQRGKQNHAFMHEKRNADAMCGDFVFVCGQSLNCCACDGQMYGLKMKRPSNTQIAVSEFRIQNSCLFFSCWSMEILQQMISLCVCGFWFSLILLHHVHFQWEQQKNSPFALYALWVKKVGSFVKQLMWILTWKRAKSVDHHCLQMNR